MTCLKLAVTEPDLYYKITPMYKCYWHWINQCLINKQCPETIKPKQWPVQSAQPTHCKCKGDDTSDTCAAVIEQISIWLANKAGNKKTRKTTCSKSAANAQGLCKQDTTYSTCAAEVEQIIIQLANNLVNKITEIMTCSKSTANALRSCKQNDTNGVC